MHIKIGTRGSKLALWQAHFIEDKLQNAGLTTEIIVINTKGDKILDRALSKIGSKGVFTEELEEQLISGQIDIAVHSAKDLQSELGSELSIIAFTEREKTSDVLISNNNGIILDENSELVIGTSSTRRVAFLKSKYPKLKIVDMRGNLQTRIQKMQAGACDALMLAYAGVHRMGYNDSIVHEFTSEILIPPVGQGTVAIEIANVLDTEKKEILRKTCNETETEFCLITERAYLKKLQGGCSIPAFGNAKILDGQISFNAGIISLDGNEEIKYHIIDKKENAELLGIKMAEKVLNAGGARILKTIKEFMN